MRLFLYEWVTGGGLAEHHGMLPESLLREGLAMVQSIAADAAAISTCQPVLMRDLRVQSLVAPGAEIVEVDSRVEHDQVFRHLSETCDATLLIAPETDQALLHAAQTAVANSAKLISPGPEFIAIAGDKEQTAIQLLRADLPVPTGRRLEPDQLLPEAFPYPAVVKPLDGAGSQDTWVVASHHERPPAYPWPRWLEEFRSGTPTSVALLCGPERDMHALPPCRQRLSNDGRLAYLGGATPLAPGLAERAIDLATRSLQALPAAIGYVGVDLILGPHPDGRDDRIIEVNPRLTTSYVGLRAAAQGNLLESMLHLAEGTSVEFEFNTRPIGFDADGAVYYE